MRRTSVTLISSLLLALVFPVGVANSSPSPSPSATPAPSISATPTPTPSPSLNKPSVSVTLKPEVVITSQTYKLSGTVYPVIRPSAVASPSPSASASASASPIPNPVTPVRIQQKVGGKWSLIATAKPTKSGRWSISLVAPATLNYLVLRVAYGKLNSQQFGIRVAVLPSIKIAGPGGRIGGVDISRWQHSILPINFKQMSNSGIAFVFIKGSDGNPDDDVITRPLANADSTSVKAAGMYVGYYHFGRVPASNSSPVLIESAQKQAKQALARLAELGGYGGYTLPYVLDIESAPSMTTSASITLWSKTWLEAMYLATGRRSIVYSYRYFLSRKFANDSGTKDYLRQSPLWLAHPGNPANPAVIPGQIDNSPGCFQSAWTLPDCTATWSFWQYTSSGDRELYGIPWSPARGTSCPTTVKYCSLFVGQSRRHLDMNVFNGSISDLMALAQGTWTQTPKPVITPSPSPTPNPTPTPSPTPSLAP